MTAALSSFGRTRRIFLLLLIFFLLQQSALIACPPDDGEVLDHFASPDSGGVAASIATEEETIDTFDVHPKNRWVETISGTTATVHDGLLDITDTGDGTGDTYDIVRDLDSLDDKIEIKFKIDISAADGTISDYFFIKLGDSDDSDVYSSLVFKDFTRNRYSQVLFEYDDDGGTYKSKVITGDERLYDDVWYILKIDYDILKSTQRWTFYFENGSRVFDYDDGDITGANRAGLWKATSLELTLYYRCFSVNIQQEVLVEYAKAPFKEREWIQTETPSDPDWSEDLYDASWSQDDINDDSQWWLNVPYLDSYSAMLEINYTSPYYGNGEYTTVGSGIWNVDADDGDLHQVLGASITCGNDGADYITGAITKDSSSYWTFGRYYQITQPRLHVIVELHEDRSLGHIKCRFWVDKTDDNNYEDFYVDVDISDCSVVPSQEFSIRNYHRHKFTVDMEATTLINDIGIAERDRLAGFPKSLHHSSTSEPNNWLAQLFIDMGRFIASAFAFVLGPLIEILDLAIAALGVIMESVATAIGALAEGIWTALGDSLDFITEAIGVVVENFFTWLWNIASEMADFLMEILDFVFVLAGNIFAGIINFLAGALFFFWEALNLPDILSWAEFGLDYFTSFSGWLLETAIKNVTLMIDLSWIVLVGWWVWAIPIQWGKAGFEPLGGLSNFIDAFFNNIIPIDIFGFHFEVPQGIVFTLWLIAILPADFALFTAMSS